MRMKAASMETKKSYSNAASAATQLFGSAGAPLTSATDVTMPRTVAFTSTR
jgi:hypothetical protein